MNCTPNVRQIDIMSSMWGDLMPKGETNKRYTAGFKQMVVETIHREKFSYREMVRQFKIADHERVAAWGQIYLTEGLAVEHRGRRRSTDRPRNCRIRGGRPDIRGLVASGGEWIPIIEPEVSLN